MAQRYGRKRKRAHLELMARQQHKIDGFSIIAVKDKNRVNYLERLIAEWDHEISNLLGEYSAFLSSTPTMNVKHVEDVRRMALRVPLPKLRGPEAFDMIDHVKQHSTYIHRFIMEINRNDPVYLRELIRLKISDTQATVQYAMSSEMIRARLFGDREMEWLANEIATQFIGLLKRPKRV